MEENERGSLVDVQVAKGTEIEVRKQEVLRVQSTMEGRCGHHGVKVV